jgi:hypothetical protein
MEFWMTQHDTWTSSVTQDTAGFQEGSGALESVSDSVRFALRVPIMTLEDFLCRTSLTITLELTMRIPRRETVDNIQEHALSFRAMTRRNYKDRHTLSASSPTGK